MREVVVVSGVRTAIGTYGGSLKDTPPTELAAQVVRESLARAGVEGKDVGHVVFGHVLNTEPKDMYLSRVAAINGGCVEGTPAFNVNRLCGSGLQAIVSASQAIMLGDCDIAIGGGAENMSRGPYASLSARWGARMGDSKMVDMVVGALHAHSTPSIWVSPLKTLPLNTASPVKCKMPWQYKAITVHSVQQKQVTLKTKSRQSCSRAKKAK